MSRLSLVYGISCLVLAGVIFILADGARRWYSGSFFLVLGLVTLGNTPMWRNVPGDGGESD